MLIAMAGLPGTGKSTLAARLAGELDGVVLNKDAVRAALFPPPALDYSADQNDTAMAAVFAAAGVILRAHPHRAVILDGRTFSRPGQLDPALALVDSLGEPLWVIECVCTDDVARARLDRDAAAGAHPAADRTFGLYRRVKAVAVPLRLPRLTLDTGVLTPDECVCRALSYLRGQALDDPSP